MGLGLRNRIGVGMGPEILDGAAMAVPDDTHAGGGTSGNGTGKAIRESFQTVYAVSGALVKARDVRDFLLSMQRGVLRTVGDGTHPAVGFVDDEVEPASRGPALKSRGTATLGAGTHGPRSHDGCRLPSSSHVVAGGAPQATGHGPIQIAADGAPQARRYRPIQVAADRISVVSGGDYSCMKMKAPPPVDLAQQRDAWIGAAGIESRTWGALVTSRDA